MADYERIRPGGFLFVLGTSNLLSHFVTPFVSYVSCFVITNPLPIPLPVLVIFFPPYVPTFVIFNPLSILFIILVACFFLYFSIHVIP